MKKNKHKKRVFTIVMAFLLITIISLTIFLVFFNQTNKIENNTNLGELNLSNKSTEEAKNIIEKRAKEIEEQGLIFSYNNIDLTVPNKVVAFDSELSYEIFSIKQEASFKKLIENQTKNIFFKIFSRLNKNKPTHIEAEFHFHEERFEQTLNKLFEDYIIEVKNAYFDFNENNELIIVPEVYGLTIDKKENIKKTKNYLANLKLEKIPFAFLEIKPNTTSEDLSGKEQLVINLLEEDNFELTYQKEKWSLEKKDIVKWIILSEENENKLSLDIDKIKNYLKLELAPKIDRLAKQPSFIIENEKIKNWQPGKSGRKLIIEDSAQNIFNLLINKETEAKLIVEETMGEDAEGLAKEIIEIIGTGHSNFAGSPNNRIHNIKVGTDIFHGLIIAPDEEFSAIENLGPINKETGYLPELVIKDNQTIPEYGGGLCQVSTTLFRAALSTGLPITARQAHSYRVSYYEPAGTDASIYNPWPDLKFINDTDHHIMIQSRLIGNDLYFDFWGTSDKREVSISDPVIYNIVSPPPTKLIVSEELAPGERKCTERAHNGANAYFDYVVKHQDGETIEKRFNSYYVPWQEVCLIGPDEEEVLENDEDVEEEDNNEDL
jgi:vancomycin resistance protein YoaR